MCEYNKSLGHNYWTIPIWCELPGSQVILSLFELFLARVHLLTHSLEHEVNGRIEQHPAQLGRPRVLGLLQLLDLVLELNSSDFFKATPVRFSAKPYRFASMNDRRDVNWNLSVTAQLTNQNCQWKNLVLRYDQKYLIKNKTSNITQLVIKLYVVVEHSSISR